MNHKLIFLDSWVSFLLLFTCNHLRFLICFANFVRMRNLLLSTVLFGALPLFSQSGTYCIQNRFSETAFFDSSKITVVKDVVYSIPSKWPGSGVDTLKLDLYYPSDAAETLSKRPAIVFFYGGAWLFGNKNDAGIKQKCYEWARRGFVVAAPNYRLGWNCNASDLLGTCILCQVNYFDMNTAVYRGAQDAKAAMRFMVANQTSYKIDTSYLFIGGESAGSFNAMHAAQWNHEFGKKVFGGNPYKKLGSLDSAGGNLNMAFRVRGIINSCGAVISDTALKLKAIPTVSFHDESDCVVPYQTNRVINCCATSFFYARGSSVIHTELTNAGISSELYHVPGFTPAHCSYPNITLVKESSCFIKKQLCGLSGNSSKTYPVSPAVSCNALQSNATEELWMADLRIGPSPAFDKLMISGPTANQLRGIQLYQTNGSACETEYVLGNEGIEISTQGLPTGLYLLTLTFENGEIGTRKVAVVRE